jgi:hypothetical protein
MRRVHDQHGHLLVGAVQLLDLVVDRRIVLTADPWIGLALAAIAGFSQLFSP